jgi:N-carbamoylputrescine amidase
MGDVDLKALEDIRRNWPFLRDRRIDAYAPIAKRFLDPVKKRSKPGKPVKSGEKK